MRARAEKEKQLAYWWSQKLLERTRRAAENLLSAQPGEFGIRSSGESPRETQDLGEPWSTGISCWTTVYTASPLTTYSTRLPMSTLPSTNADPTWRELSEASSPEPSSPLGILPSAGSPASGESSSCEDTSFPHLMVQSSQPITLATLCEESGILLGWFRWTYLRLLRWLGKGPLASQ